MANRSFERTRPSFSNIGENNRRNIADFSPRRNTLSSVPNTPRFERHPSQSIADNQMMNGSAQTTDFSYNSHRVSTEPDSSRVQSQAEGTSFKNTFPPRYAAMHKEESHDPYDDFIDDEIMDDEIMDDEKSRWESFKAGYSKCKTRFISGCKKLKTGVFGTSAKTIGWFSRTARSLCCTIKSMVQSMLILVIIAVLLELVPEFAAEHPFIAGFANTIADLFEGLYSGLFGTLNVLFGAIKALFTEGFMESFEKLGEISSKWNTLFEAAKAFWQFITSL